MLSERLKELRTERGLLQADVAKIIKVKPQTYSTYENGREPSYQTLIALAAYFGVSTDFLLGISELRKPENASFVKELGLSEKAIDMLRTHEEVQIFVQGESVPRAKTIDFLSSLLEDPIFYFPFLDMLFILSEPFFDDMFPPIDLTNPTPRKEESFDKVMIESYMRAALDKIIEQLREKKRGY